MKNSSRLVQSALSLSAIIVVLLGLAIQFIPYGHDRTNPPVLAEPAWDSPRTRALFFRACADCHTNETVWPFYSKIAPVSWLVARDVKEGRGNLNISEWGRAINEGDEAADEVSKGGMPLRLYVIVHPSAKLSSAERQEFIKGLRATFGKGESKGHVEGEKDEH